MNPEDRPDRTASIILARPGEQLPGTPYRLVERLGGGGMGQVFRAEHVELGREVAVKLLAPALAHDPKAMERLRREARAAARLGNPHIIDVYDLGITDDGRPYVVMKLIAGRDLKEIIDVEAPADPERVVRMARQIGDALRDAHAAGVVHRDLKPENILVERRGDEERVTILDFGIAQSIQDTDTRLTRDGQMIGTPGYMAPEQALARPLDGRADQYALSVIVYELLSGASPFQRVTALQLIAAQLTSEPVPLGQVVDPAAVPPAMVDVVMRGLERDPDARYPEVMDFVDALDAARRGTLAPPAPAGARAGRRGGVFGLIALVTLLVAGGVLWAFYRPATTGGEADRGVTLAAAAVDAAPPPADATVEADAAALDAAPSVEPDAAPAAEPDAGAEPTRVAQRPTTRRTRRVRPSPAVESPKPAPPKPAPPKPAPPKPAPPTSAPDTEDPTSALPTSPSPTAEAKPAAAVVPEPIEPVEPAPPPKPAAPPVLRFGTLDVVGGASTRRIRKTVEDAFPAIRRCVAGADDLSAGARATVRFAIDADGFFGQFGADGEKALADCGLSVLRRINRLARRPDTGDIRVALPMRMEAP